MDLPLELSCGGVDAPALYQVLSVSADGAVTLSYTGAGGSFQTMTARLEGGRLVDARVSQFLESLFRPGVDSCGYSKTHTFSALVRD